MSEAVVQLTATTTHLRTADRFRGALLPLVTRHLRHAATALTHARIILNTTPTPTLPPRNSGYGRPPGREGTSPLRRCRREEIAERAVGQPVVFGVCGICQACRAAVMPPEGDLAGPSACLWPNSGGRTVGPHRPGPGAAPSVPDAAGGHGWGNPSWIGWRSAASPWCPRSCGERCHASRRFGWVVRRPVLSQDRRAWASRSQVPGGVRQPAGIMKVRS